MQHFQPIIVPLFFLQYLLHVFHPKSNYSLEQNCYKNRVAFIQKKTSPLNIFISILTKATCLFSWSFSDVKDHILQLFMHLFFSKSWTLMFLVFLATHIGKYIHIIFSIKKGWKHLWDDKNYILNSWFLTTKKRSSWKSPSRISCPRQNWLFDSYKSE